MIVFFRRELRLKNRAGSARREIECNCGNLLNSATHSTQQMNLIKDFTKYKSRSRKLACKATEFYQTQASHFHESNFQNLGKNKYRRLI